MSIARTIKRLGITFRSNVELVAFAGEEQGLYGSRYYAGAYARAFRLLRDSHPATGDLRKEEKNLTLMVQADMIAYHEPGEPAQLGLPAL